MAIFDDLSLLRAFVCIVDSGSISAASRRMHLTQPTLSRYLRTLEERCGKSLIYRDTHRMHLSPAGQAFLETARSLLALADEAEQRLHNDQTELQGHIRLFSTIDFGQSVVTRLIASFIQANPAVTVGLTYSNRPMRKLKEGCDFGIIAGDITDDTVKARFIGTIRRLLVASPELVGRHNKVSEPKDLQSWPWLNIAGRQFHIGGEIILDSPGEKEQRLAISPVLTSEGVASLREAACMGLGVTVLPEWLIREDLVAGRLVEVLPSWHPEYLPANIVYPVQRSLPLRVRTFIDFTSAYIAAVLNPGDSVMKL